MASNGKKTKEWKKSDNNLIGDNIILSENFKIRFTIFRICTYVFDDIFSEF